MLYKTIPEWLSSIYCYWINSSLQNYKYLTISLVCLRHTELVEVLLLLPLLVVGQLVIDLLPVGPDHEPDQPEHDDIDNVSHDKYEGDWIEEPNGAGDGEYEDCAHGEIQGDEVETGDEQSLSLLDHSDEEGDAGEEGEATEHDVDAAHGEDDG